MGVSVTNFGNQKAVFANQDEGIFSAIPITFDESVLTLETYTQNSKKFVKAGSLVKQGSTIKGITAEEYEITNGPRDGRVVLEGYVYVEALTSAAAGAMSSLPKIVPIPYGKIIFTAVGTDGKVIYIKTSGTVWSAEVATGNFTVNANTTVKSVTVSSNDASVVELTVEKATDATGNNGSITAIAAAAVIGSTGKVIAGLPINFTFVNGEVCLDA